MNRTKILLFHHLIVGTLATITVYLFYVTSQPTWPAPIRFWNSCGDVAFIFLCITLAIGPLARLWKKVAKLISWRREIGIWFAVLAFTHFLGTKNQALSEPGLELPTILGFIALFFSVLLALTSSDAAIRFLGNGSWKWLHRNSYIIFYVIAAHAAFFIFFYSDEKNWFRYPFLIMAFSIPILQLSAFIKTVWQQRKISLNKPL